MMIVFKCEPDRVLMELCCQHNYSLETESETIVKPSSLTLPNPFRTLPGTDILVNGVLMSKQI